MREIIGRWIAHWKMKWGIFAYNYGWSNYVFLFDGWIPKLAMAVPIVGYLILFNDTISQHLSFNRLTDEGTLRFGLSSLTRLKLIYFGLIFLGLANILYRIRRPFVLKIGTNQFDYVEKALAHFTVSDYININGEIKTKGHYTTHGKYYDAEFEASCSRISLHSCRATLRASPPGLTRWSMLTRRMDCRIKSGNDELEKHKTWMTGTSPAMTSTRRPTSTVMLCEGRASSIHQC